MISAGRVFKLLSLFAVFSIVIVDFAAAKIVKDSAGRDVEVPDKINRVFAAGPPASILLYVLAPEKLTGWPRPPKAYERPYIAEPYRNLPETGRLTGRGDTANLETVIKTTPDLILDFGSILKTYISLANAVQEQTGIPYILIDGRFENTSAALRLLGAILGVEERAEKLASYVDKLFEDLASTLAEIPTGDRPRVYLARGPAGLETGLKGSINTEIIERAGGRNVADPGEASIRRGIVQTSIEQVIAANPDMIITWDRNYFRSVWNDPLWAGIEAVKRKRVFLGPTAPFGWIDRPPSINRIIGLRWLSGLFYPRRFSFNLRKETQNFYKLFYHIELTDELLDGLIEWAKGHP